MHKYSSEKKFYDQLSTFRPANNLSPKSDQLQFSPNKINRSDQKSTDHQEKRLWEFIK